MKTKTSGGRNPQRHSLRLEPLEPRVLLSGDPLNLVLISDAVAQAQQIRAAAAPDTIAIVYDSNSMTTTELVDLVASVSAAHNGAQIGHLGIVAHGGPGEIDLGKGDDLSLATMPSQAAALEGLRAVLTTDARLDLYSCSVAAGLGGETFVNELSAVTGAAVFASDNPVGTVPGSDFAWDYHTGNAVANNDLLSVRELETIPGLCLYYVGERVQAASAGANVRDAALDSPWYAQAAGVHGTIQAEEQGSAGGFTGNWWKISWDSTPPNYQQPGWSAESVIATVPTGGDFSEPNLYSSYYASADNIFWKGGYAPSWTNPPNPQLGVAQGNCTWYAFGRELQLGYNSTQLSALHGMAGDWASEANAAGIPVNSTPTVGSIAQITYSGSSGHVAVVESVNGDGTITVTESSYIVNASDPGDDPWNIAWHNRTCASTWFQNFIHVSTGSAAEQGQVYSAQAATAYANTWWNGKNGPPPNGPYNYYTDEDCANFVSQCLIAGGLDLSTGSTDAYGSIISCTNLKNYLTSIGAPSTVLTRVQFNAGLREPLSFVAGDVVIFQDDSGATGHAMIDIAGDATHYATLAAHTFDTNTGSIAGVFNSTYYLDLAFTHCTFYELPKLNISTLEDTALGITLPGTDAAPEVGQVLTFAPEAAQVLAFAIETGPTHGTLSGFNSATGAVTYTPDPNYNGPDSLTFTVTDDALAGAPATLKSPAAMVSITVTGVNDAPVNGVPGAQAVDEDTNLVFSTANGNPMTVSDVDADPDPVQVTLAATNGSLTLNGTAGLSFAVGDGTTDPMLQFTGTLASINAALNGLVFRGFQDYNGAASVTIDTNDLAHSGSGGALQDTDILMITVNPVNDDPVFQPPLPADPSVILVGQPFAFDFNATDVDLDPLTYSLVSGPSWLSVDAATGVLSGTPNRRAHIADDQQVIVRVEDGQGGSDEHTFHLTVQGQVIALGAGLPVPLGKTTFTDASGDLVSVSGKGVGTAYLIRGVAPDAWGNYSNNTPGDLVAIEAQGTNAGSGISVKTKALVKGVIPTTSVGDVVVNGSLKSLSAPLLNLDGNLNITGGVGTLTLGNVADQHTLTIGSDPLMKPGSVVLGRVKDASLTSTMPLKSLSVVEWRDTDATPDDQITAPWISKLTSQGDFEASLNLSGVGARKGTLGKTSIAGMVTRATWSITGVASSVSVGAWSNASITADWLTSVTASNRILGGGAPYEIRAHNGSFTVRDITGSGLVPPDRWFGTLRAYVG